MFGLLFSRILRLITLLVTIGSLPAVAQDFTLFEPFEAESVAETSAPQQESSEVGVAGNDPVFRLLGSSRIGYKR